MTTITFGNGRTDVRDESKPLVQRRSLCANTGRTATLTFAPLLRHPYMHWATCDGCHESWPTTTSPEEWGTPVSHEIKHAMSGEIACTCGWVSGHHAHTDDAVDEFTQHKSHS